jgi:two-component system, LytTR family, response regulator
VDDEPLARSNLSILLRQDLDIGGIEECSSGTEAVERIRSSRPPLVFLDVQMPECDGFDVLEMLGRNLPPAIILVTAYDQYALRAFAAGALDYLLKPFDNARFRLALARAKEKLLLAESPRKSDRLTVKSAGEIAFVKISEIDWIEAADYYACLHVGSKNYLLRRSLAELDEELDPSQFCRIHRSSIVNLDRIRGLKLNVDGDYDVLFDTGAKFRLSRRYRKQLQERLGLRDSSGTSSARPK